MGHGLSLLPSGKKTAETTQSASVRDRFFTDRPIPRAGDSERVAEQKLNVQRRWGTDSVFQGIAEQV